MAAISVGVNISTTMLGNGFAANPFYATSLTNASGLAPTQVTVNNTTTTVAIPAAANGVLVVPPNNSISRLYKGNVADAGFASNGPFMFVSTTSGAQANIAIGTTGNETFTLIWL